MKQIGKTSLGIALVVAAAMLAGTSSRAYGYLNQVWPDSLVMSTAIGTSTDGYIFISDGRDTTDQTQSKGTVHVRISGNSEFTMLTDSVIDFVGEAYVRIRFSPTITSHAFGQIEIVGDSNTLTVQLIGIPVDHFPVGIGLASYDSLHVGHEYCQNVTIQNTQNSNSISVTDVYITQTGSAWSLSGVPSFPFTIDGHSAEGLFQLCALATASDSDLRGTLTVVYTIGGIKDSTTVSLDGHRWPQSGTCVTADGVISDAIAEGASTTDWFDLTNNTDSSVYLDSAQIIGTDNGRFTIVSPSFPLVLSQGQSVKVNMKSTVPSPAMKDNYYATFETQVYGMSPDGIACEPVSVPLHIEVSIPVVDSITLEVPPGSNTLSITAHVTKSRHAIFIHNSGSNKLLLQSLSVSASDSSIFVGFPPSDGATIYLYDSLAPGATTGAMGAVLLTLESPDTGTYDLDMTLSYEIMQAGRKGGATPASNSLNYTVVAHRLPPITEGVSEPNTPAPVDFTLSPNPARDEVTISLPQDGTSTIEVYDVLGNLLLHRTAQSEFVWNGTANGSPLANGTYIVRVSHGNQVSSERLVFVR